MGITQVDLAQYYLRNEKEEVSEEKFDRLVDFIDEQFNNLDDPEKEKIALQLDSLMDEDGMTVDKACKQLGIKSPFED